MAGAEPRRRLAVLTCMDARIEPLSLLELEVGDAHVIRNAGGLVTDDALRSLGISQRALGTEEVVLMMHEDCGMQGAPKEAGGFENLEDAVREGLERLRAAPELPSRERIRGLIFDPGDGTVREVA